MKTASVQQLKSELLQMEPHKLTEICIALAKFKKENKEMLDFLVFGIEDQANYIQEVKSNLELILMSIQTERNFYFIKKGIRKAQRFVNRYAKYISSADVNVELRLFLCELLLELKVSESQKPQLWKIMAGEIKRIDILIKGLHEDLQFDYRLKLEEIIARMD